MLGAYSLFLCLTKYVANAELHSAVVKCFPLFQPLNETEDYVAKRLEVEQGGGRCVSIFLVEIRPTC